MMELGKRQIRSCTTGCVYLRAGIALFLSIGGIALAALALAPAKSAGPKGGAMTPAPAGVTRLPETLPPDMPMALTIVLNRADQSGFEKSLQAMQDPKSPSYQHYLSPREQAEHFGPSASSYSAVSEWLKQQGFKLIEGSANRLTLTVSGTREQAEKAFGVHIENYRLGDRIFYANDHDPLVPARLAPRIQAVTGLSTLAEAKPGSLKDKFVFEGCFFASIVGGFTEALNIKDDLEACGYPTNYLEAYGRAVAAFGGACLAANGYKDGPPYFPFFDGVPGIYIGCERKPSRSL